MAVEQRLKPLEEQREAILEDLYRLAVHFYSLDPDHPQGRILHRMVSQQMAYKAIDLVLPHVLRDVSQNNLKRIALVTPLRGGLALVTPETISYLKESIRYYNKTDIPIDLWAVGIKRHPEKNHADIYYRLGYNTNDTNRNQYTHAILLDWGVATGLTNSFTARDLYDHGVGFGHMTAVGMALTDSGKKLIENTGDGFDHPYVVGATRAGMNDVNYIDRLAPADGGQFQPVSPKDWGDVQLGNWSDPDPVTVGKLISEFMEEFKSTFSGAGTDEDFAVLNDYYRHTYLPETGFPAYE